MAKILINDGMEAEAVAQLRQKGFEVQTEHIPQAELMEKLNHFDAIVVRSATKVRKELMDASPNLKLIGRGGVGLDNIDVDYAQSKGIKVINTPNASSRSVAELCLGHILSLYRYLHDSNRLMPTNGNTQFGALKKRYAAGLELEGKKIGIIGFGRIGSEVARIALGLGMEVLFHDPYVGNATITVGIAAQNFNTILKCRSMDDVLSCDIVTLHVPGSKEAIVGKKEIGKMKDGAILINVSRGGLVDEEALLEALNSGKLAGAGLDVFLNEPEPSKDILLHPNISLTPHTGASTIEAQSKIGTELVSQICDFFAM
jgi:D-3-phosphoglycerate dehydrogenase / 2-oxoglutarate reductase